MLCSYLNLYRLTRFGQVMFLKNLYWFCLEVNGEKIKIISRFHVFIYPSFTKVILNDNKEKTFNNTQDRTYLIITVNTFNWCEMVKIL